MTPGCKCFITNGYPEANIVRCPLHAAAHVMRDALKRIADQIEWKPPWDDAGWIECYRLARAALDLAEKGMTDDAEVRV